MPTTTLRRACSRSAIPNVAGPMAEALRLDDTQVAVGFLTVDQDDPTYVAIDEATKKAAVDVVFARSFYGGAAYPSGSTSGEILAILASQSIAEVDAGLDAAIGHLESRVSYRSSVQAGRDTSLTWWPRRAATCPRGRGSSAARRSAI